MQVRSGYFTSLFTKEKKIDDGENWEGHAGIQGHVGIKRRWGCWVSWKLWWISHQDLRTVLGYWKLQGRRLLGPWQRSQHPFLARIQKTVEQQKLFKKDSCNDPGNYRLVSFTLVAGKQLKILIDMIYPHLWNDGFIWDNQRGFVLPHKVFFLKR